MRALAVVGLAGLALITPAKRPDSKYQYDQRTLLKNYALSQCVARAYGIPEVREDALAAAGAYLESGTLAPKAYADVVRLIDHKLQQSYRGKSGRELVFMKCVDLFHSHELKEIARRHLGDGGH